MSRSCARPAAGRRRAQARGQGTQRLPRAITRTAQGEWLIAFEREHRILALPLPPMRLPAGSEDRATTFDRRGRNQCRDRDAGGLVAVTLAGPAANGQSLRGLNCPAGSRPAWRASLPSRRARRHRRSGAAWPKLDAALQGRRPPCFRPSSAAINPSEGNRAAGLSNSRRQYRQGPSPLPGPAGSPSNNFRKEKKKKRLALPAEKRPDRQFLYLRLGRQFSAIATEMRAPDASATAADEV